MSNLAEDEKIKAFVQALTIALQNNVGKSPGSAVNKRKRQKHKKTAQGKTKRVEQKS